MSEPLREVVARAPGKLVVLGEYAVLLGAPALVLAVDRRAHASVAARPGPSCRLETRFPETVRIDAPAADAPTGVALVDVVREVIGNGRNAWQATLDSAEFFASGRKLGLGSSAAALCAFAGAWAGFAGLERPSLETLIDAHRRFQGGAGSGIDVAASLHGGALVFRLSEPTVHHVSSVQLPNSVGFAGIFAGRSASTPALLSTYHSWRQAHPSEAAERQRTMERIAEAGCAAARRGESEEFLDAVKFYGRELDELGKAIGADIVTEEHRALARTANRFGVIYKVSGAGGGDLGVALAADPEALDAFERAAAKQGFHVVQMSLDRQGLVVEERTQ